MRKPYIGARVLYKDDIGRVHIADVVAVHPGGKKCDLAVLVYSTRGPHTYEHTSWGGAEYGLDKKQWRWPEEFPSGHPYEEADDRWKDYYTSDKYKSREPDG